MADTLQDQQFALSRHLRDPSHPPPPGIEERRLAIYRDLFFNNIESLLAGNFPVIRQTLGDDAWRRLVRSFYARHRSQTPLFPEIAREFIRFLETRTGEGDPPWLRELAHYEWVELALQIADDATPPHDPRGDLLADVPVVSPFVWALAYQWPVHRIGPDFQPDLPPPRRRSVDWGRTARPDRRWRPPCRSRRWRRRPSRCGRRWAVSRRRRTPGRAGCSCA